MKRISILQNEVPMRKVMFIILSMAISGCSTYKLAIPFTINKQDNITVVILPFNDLTNQFDRSLNLEQKIVDKANNEFQGIYTNPFSVRERPIFRRVPNPYIIKYVNSITPVKNIDKLPPEVVKMSPDVVIIGTIERIDYANLNRSVLSSYIAFGLVGAAASNVNNRKVAGFLGLRLELYNMTNKVTFLIQPVYGKSEADYPQNLSREKAIEQAVESAAENVLNMVFSLKE